MENGQDAAILKHFYTSTAPGVEAAREWGVDAWSDADWDSKIERIMRTYQRKQKKAAKAEEAGAPESKQDDRKAAREGRIGLRSDSPNY